MSYEQNKDDMMIAHVRQSLETHSQQAHDFDQQLQRLAEQAQRERQKRLQQHQAHKKMVVFGRQFSDCGECYVYFIKPSSNTSSHANTI